MAISRSTGVLLGTDESIGVTIANNTMTTSALVDMLGDNTSDGLVWLYVVFTSTVTAGSVQLRFSAGRRANSGTEEYVKTSYEISIPPINGTQKIPLGVRPCPRYLAVDVLNNATGASATNVTVGYELVKAS
jgi:hypothetical protein